MFPHGALGLVGRHSGFFLFCVRILPQATRTLHLLAELFLPDQKVHIMRTLTKRPHMTQHKCSGGLGGKAARTGLVGISIGWEAGNRIGSHQDGGGVRSDSVRSPLLTHTYLLHQQLYDHDNGWHERNESPPRSSGMGLASMERVGFRNLLRGRNGTQWPPPGRFE